MLLGTVRDFHISGTIFGFFIYIRLNIQRKKEKEGIGLNQPGDAAAWAKE